MPVTPTYPGVYIQEIPSGVRTIAGVATSITAFIGHARRGPVNDPVRIASFGDYVRTFGDLWTHSTMGYAVMHYFQNGGTDAIIVRVQRDATPATLRLPDTGPLLTLSAANVGSWGNHLQVQIDHDTRDPLSDESLFSLSIRDTLTQRVETARNVSLDPDHPRYVGRVLEQTSTLARLESAAALAEGDPIPRPNTQGFDDEGSAFSGGNDGNDLTANQYNGNSSNKEGIYALEQTDLFNMLCIPPLTRESDVSSITWNAALAYCKTRRAMLLVDPPRSWTQVSDVLDPGTGINARVARDQNAGVFSPFADARPPQRKPPRTLCPMGRGGRCHLPH